MKYSIEIETSDGSLEPFMETATKKEAIHKARFIANNCFLSNAVKFHVYNKLTGLTVISFKRK